MILKMTEHSLEKIVSLTLRIGVVLSSICMVIGFFCYAFNPQAHTELGVIRPSGLFLYIRTLTFTQVISSPLLFLTLGTLILIATPIIRVAVTIVGFSLEKDWKFFWISVTVLCIIGISILVAVIHL